MKNNELVIYAYLDASLRCQNSTEALIHKSQKGSTACYCAEPATYLIHSGYDLETLRISVLHFSTRRRAVLSF